MTIPLVASQLHVVFEDFEAEVALDDDESRPHLGLQHLHRLLLDGEVGEDLLGLLLDTGGSDGRAGREDQPSYRGGLDWSPHCSGADSGGGDGLDWRYF